ncbi:MAG: ATP-binding protein [Thermodesulfovibrionales bacterium]
MLSISVILILLAVIAILYLRLRRFNLAMDEIVTFINSFLSGDFRRAFIVEDNSGKVSSALNAMVSEIRDRLKEIEEERNRMQAILKCMTDGVLITDTNARVILANPSIRSLLGIKTDIVGEPVIVATRIPEMHDLVMKVVDTEKELSEEITITYPHSLCLMAAAVPLYLYEDRKRVSGVVLSLHDITKIKKLEDMRKSFVANVSHEIKTPITAIKGFAETLLDGALDDRENAIRFLDTIKSHSERINSLVDDLLTLSRIEMGDIKIEKQDVNLSRVIDTVFAILRGNALAKGLYLRKSLPPEPIDIHADSDRLIQILLNLVDNGIKFTENGGVTVGVERIGGVSNSGGQDVVFVEDTGIGIPRQHLPRLGERFYRVDRARSRELGGTGLGLAIVKHLVNAHGWKMEIESTQGRGTKVKILIS